MFFQTCLSIFTNRTLYGEEKKLEHGNANFQIARETLMNAAEDPNNQYYIQSLLCLISVNYLCSKLKKEEHNYASVRSKLKEAKDTLRLDPDFYKIILERLYLFGLEEDKKELFPEF